MTRSLLSFLAVVLVATALAGCYSTRVSTPLEPNGNKIEKNFATGFLFGLATPGANIYAERCQHGMARMESKYSFLNMVASNLTLGLYTPMHVEVFCAEPGSETSAMPVPNDSTSTPVPFKAKK